jgi:4-alpha-glucanotransferase
MKLVFKIEYYTEFGQNLFVSGNLSELGSWDKTKAAGMTYVGDGKWELEIYLDSISSDQFEYKYFIKDNRNSLSINEWGQNRKFKFKGKKFYSYFFDDSWRSNTDPQNPLFTAAYSGNLWRRKSKKPKKGSSHINNVFQLLAPRIDNDHVFCIVGSDKMLGNWNPDKAVIMDGSQYPMWKAEVFLENSEGTTHYKYGLYNLKKGKFIGYENGNNRAVNNILSVIDNGITIKTDIKYNYPEGLWKGAGVAIPVFSLRTDKSFGVGEFTDLKVLVDWSVKAGLKLVQILPINDTVANHTWKDSYPYAAISVFALHPVYLNLVGMGRLSDKKLMESFQKKGKKLNKLDTFDYVSVMDLKSKYFKLLYDQEKEKFLEDKKYKKFFKENKDWLIPYAAFSCLRDRYGSPDFTKWPTHSTYNEAEIQKLVKSTNKDFDDFAVHYFIQFHLHLQLSEVVEHARSKGVILKGDLPIGIYRDSVDAWVEPGLYHMDKQAGAPPDAYSTTGQNWRFPTYNWNEMAKDNYSWWRRRLNQMAKYFDAYRIDHILGFFRIWEIPYDSIEGLMGIFNPAIPIYKNEIESRGIQFDYNRLCKSLIKNYMLEDLFGDSADEVKNLFLIENEDGSYVLKEEFDTQRKVEDHFLANALENKEQENLFRNGLFTLIGNVLFFEEPGSNGNAFHPKIAFHSTYSYKELDDHTKSVLNDIYTNYYYHKQENFWREQAMVKLPAINKASDMLICGEDLGMVPDCVPGVMHDMGILRLYIQRMPKETDSEFGHPAHAPYLSVASPSCHDMSTVRGWWEEDHDRSQRFYTQIMGHHGEAPQVCDTWISEEVVQQHLHSSAMWTIFPIQDLVGIDEKLMRKSPDDERINDPSNPDNLWQYRFHLNLGDLVKEKEFNKKLHSMVQNAGRATKF